MVWVSKPGPGTEGAWVEVGERSLLARLFVNRDKTKALPRWVVKCAEKKKNKMAGDDQFCMAGGYH